MRHILIVTRDATTMLEKGCKPGMQVVCWVTHVAQAMRSMSSFVKDLAKFDALLHATPIGASYLYANMGAMSSMCVCVWGGWDAIKWMAKVCTGREGGVFWGGGSSCQRGQGRKAGAAIAWQMAVTSCQGAVSDLLPGCPLTEEQQAVVCPD